MVNGVIFDLDGVICDTAEYHYLAWKELGDKLGISLDREFNENLKGISRIESLERILELGSKQQEYTIAEKEKLTTEKNELYLELIKGVTPNDLLPGINEFLHSLKKEGFKIGLASASINAPLLLEKLEIKSLFNTIVDPTTLTNGKPDPDIFLKGAKQLDLPVSECIGIEDSYSGIQAINGAGMFSVGIGDRSILTEANIVYPSTVQLDVDRIVELVK